MVYFFTFLALCVAASAATAQSFSRRDAADVFNVFRVIEQSYSRGTLIADAQSFDGSTLGALDFGQQVDIVTQLTTAATNSLASESPLNSSISTEVTTLLGTFAGDVSQFLDAIVEKEPDFDNEPATRSLVENFVNNNAFATFGYVSTLAGLVSDDQTATASAAAAAISGSYAEALDTLVG